MRSTLGAIALSVVAVGCADPLMRKSQLPQTIDYSGGGSSPGRVFVALPATAPTGQRSELLRPASLPGAGTTAPTTEPSKLEPPQ